MDFAVLTLSQELIDDFPVSDPRWAESIPAGLCVAVNLSQMKRNNLMKNTIGKIFYQWLFNRFMVNVVPSLYEKIQAVKCLNLVVFIMFKVCPCHFKILVTNNLIRVVLPRLKDYGTDVLIVSASLE